jgi:hypothetical protein
LNTPLMHRCAAEGCAKQVRTTLLMCPHHWFKVPVATRHQVLMAWAKYQQGALSIDELRAVQAAAISSASPRGDTFRASDDTVKGGAL